MLYVNQFSKQHIISIRGLFKTLTPPSSWTPAACPPRTSSYLHASILSNQRTSSWTKLACQDLLFFTICSPTSKPRTQPLHPIGTYHLGDNSYTPIHVTLALHSILNTNTLPLGYVTPHETTNSPNSFKDIPPLCSNYVKPYFIHLTTTLPPSYSTAHST